MEEDDGGQEVQPPRTDVENDLSGEVRGSVFQVGSISGDMNVSWPGAVPVEAIPIEKLSEELRQSARCWRARFGSVDFVNLPRIAMIGGGAVSRAAQASGLDVTKPFYGQGFAPGLFVATASSLFETWNTEAVVLGEATVGRVCPGVPVSFEASMQCVNPPFAPPHAPTGELALDPHLVFSIGEHRVIVTFDPQWLTTTTAGGTLHDAAEDPQTYSGLGIVAGVHGDGRVRIRALVFGQPQTAEVSLWNYIASSPDPARDVMVDDFRNELSTIEQVGSDIDEQLRETAVERSGMVLVFDEDEVMPGDIDRDVLAQALRVVPEFRRDLSIAVASLLPPREMRVDDIAARLLVRKPALWKTFTVPGFASLIRSRNLAVATVSGLGRENMVDLDAALREEVKAYLGGMEFDRDLNMQRQLFPSRDRYHMVGTELRLIYTAMSRHTAEANGEDLDGPLNEWLDTDLFKSVAWEEDEEESETEEREAAMILEGWLRSQGDWPPV
ncbi:hypothetical protein [Spirillospora sp. NPDC048819]|uniref:hypothetical protein n=1 Tax=Spirillospora sp. NPDC048819 TaxID=3155268 RepID=UPI0033FEAA84